MGKIIRIGTRESQLAVWQAEQVKKLLAENGFAAELVYIKSEGDVDLKTPLYEMGVQGVFTRSLDIALLNNRIDVAVHSMKDVPTQLPAGIIQASVLKRGPIHDLLVFKNTFSKNKYSTLNLPSGSAGIPHSTFIVATSSIRRKAQWLNKFPDHQIENLRGNVNTRLGKLQEENWDAAIFAQAGLERINLRPANSVILDWMLPAPAQGAIMVVCREDDQFSFKACDQFNDKHTAQCTKIERDFLRTLLGGCSTPISAHAEIKNDKIHFKGNILSLDGTKKVEIEKAIDIEGSENIGINAANELLAMGGKEIADEIRKSGVSLNDEV
jgi:hydroxymethylbilane synthase